MIPESLGGNHTTANVFVTHRSCQQQYHKNYGHDTMPDSPWRFLTFGESIVQGRVVRTSESRAANN